MNCRLQAGPSAGGLDAAIAARWISRVAEDRRWRGFPPVDKSYVAGLAFSTDGGSVLLVEKLKPAWMRGLLNGIGGKVEPGEDGDRAMVREFREETGIEVSDWDLFVVLELPRARVGFYRAFTDLVDWGFPQTATRVNDVGEPLRVCRLGYPADCPRVPEPAMPNLAWLISMALDRDLIGPVVVFEDRDAARAPP